VIFKVIPQKIVEIPQEQDEIPQFTLLIPHLFVEIPQTGNFARFFPVLQNKISAKYIRNH